MKKTLDWGAIRAYYDFGHTMAECRERFGFSDWDWHAAVGRDDVVPRVRGEPVRSSEKRALIAKLRSDGQSYRTISEKLGVSKATVAYHVRRLGVAANDKCARRYNWAEVQRAVDTGLSMRQCMKRFGFSSDAWSKAVKRGVLAPMPWVTPIEELLVAGRRRSRGHLKARLIREGLKANRCEECGITDWRGRSLSMALHHVNGDGADNRLVNIRFLCPNCHAQTPNYGGRNGHRRKPATD